MTTIRVDLERLTKAQMKYPYCACISQFCGHQGRCGEYLHAGWKMRLAPPRTEFGEPQLLTPDRFEDLLSETLALCPSCAAQCPNELADPFGDSGA